ncbi:hypothetical protein C4D60_Mb01t09160 [Musa balbisiana]|uniref:Uncharacterized protein n=1 Tax=Musa balbisiana TaxID=52838 RepID=A0A4S8JL75_MUSBA|nr:hypothetical protein C4D60_Mb01t09160 [Musa balbisiana]
MADVERMAWGISGPARHKCARRPAPPHWSEEAPPRRRRTSSCERNLPVGPLVLAKPRIISRNLTDYNWTEVLNWAGHILWAWAYISFPCVLPRKGFGRRTRGRSEASGVR